MVVSDLASSIRANGSSSRSLAAEAYQHLRRQIIYCALPPAARVTEADLVKQLGLGKTPIREALGRLVQEGLVRVIPRQGYAIAPITLRAVHDLFDLRLIVEPAAVQRAAAHIDVIDLRQLDALCRAGYTLGDHDSATAFLRANTEFHVSIARASGNVRLAQLLAQLLDESERLFHLGLMLRNRSDEMAHEHHDLVEALAARDTEVARCIAVSQITTSQRMVVDALLTSTALMEASVTVP